MNNTNSPYSFQNTLQVLNQNFAIVLIAVLVFVGGFGTGSLWTENRMLKANGVAAAAANQAAPAAPSASGQPQASNPPAPTQATVDFGRYPVKGNKNAKVAIVEFADLRCPFCKSYFSDTEPQVLKDYVDSGKVQYAFRQYEFLGPASVTAGNAAECANDQGKFWEFHDYMYKNQPSESDTSMFTTDGLTQVAQTLGLNTNQFKDCLSNTKDSKNVDADKSDGDKAGVTGTPTFVIGKITSDGKVDGTLLVGAQPYSQFKTTLDQLLAQ